MVAGSTANQAVKILNELGEFSNPSTEEKQDSQIALQETLQDLSNGIYDLIRLLAFLPSVRGTLADLRVTPLSTPNMSTLTTLSNQTSIGGFIATPQIPTMMNLSGQNNINNVTIT